ncbi:MAG: hypothetical protein JWN23_1040 [Rhodocyclales bacterium]|nr:hypothetical protein [Rhodocyclales bacterium]
MLPCLNSANFLTRVVVTTSLCACIQAGAADLPCGTGEPTATCSAPVIGNWDIWRFVIDKKTGDAQSSESAAIDDAVAMLKQIYSCTLSYGITDAPYAESAKVLDWTSKEDAPRISYSGVSSGNGTCQDRATESSGMVIIRRERRIACPRGYTWLIRDNEMSLCIKG